MRRLFMTALWACFLGLAPLARAAEPVTLEGLKRDNARLRADVNRLDAQVRQLLRAVQELKKPPAPPPAPTPGLTEAEARALREMLATRATAPPSIVASLDTKLYGYIKFDAAYDSSRTSAGDFARWVETEHRRGNDNQFNMTARQSRLGLLFSGKETAAPLTSGRIEADFYGDALQENKPALLLRHAYLQLDWPDRGLSILAGQTSDVISPLLPGTLNYTVGWWTGNIGYRRPQLRITKTLRPGGTETTRLTLQGALSRTVGTRTLGFFDPGDTGEDSGHPTLQGRIALATPILGEKKTTLGLSGHWGTEEYDLDDRDDHRRFRSWSLNLDLTQPLTDKLTLTGEAFLGENHDDYLGGIGGRSPSAGRRPADGSPPPSAPTDAGASTSEPPPKTPPTATSHSKPHAPSTPPSSATPSTPSASAPR